MAEMTLEELLVAASGQQSVINGLQAKAKSGSEIELILTPMFEALNRIVGWILRDYLEYVEVQFTGRQRNRSWDSDHARLLITRDTHSITVRVKDLDEATKMKVRMIMNANQAIEALKEGIAENIVTFKAHKAVDALVALGKSAVPVILAELNTRPNNYLVDLQLLDALERMDFHPSEVSREMVVTVDQFRDFYQEVGESSSIHRSHDAVSLMKKWGVNVSHPRWSTDYETREPLDTRPIEDLIAEWEATRPEASAKDELGFALDTKFVVFRTNQVVDLWIPGAGYFDSLNGKGQIHIEAGRVFILARTGKRDFQIIFPAAQIQGAGQLTVGPSWHGKKLMSARSFASKFGKTASSEAMEDFKADWIADQRRYNFAWDYDISFEALRHTRTEAAIKAEVHRNVDSHDYEAEFSAFMQRLELPLEIK